MVKEQDRRLRIIGGKWRGRKASFPPNPSIRPTPDRVRETLFNWLMQEMAGSRCLDLFAGSGALGLESLSRGASQVVFVDQDRASCQSIRKNLESLGAGPGTWQVHCSEAADWLARNPEPFDISFMDPPFSSADSSADGYRCLHDVCASTRHYVYVESAAALDASDLPTGWLIHRQKRAGAVHFSLCRPENDSV